EALSGIGNPASSSGCVTSTRLIRAVKLSITKGIASETINFKLFLSELKCDRERSSFVALLRDDLEPFFFGLSDFSSLVTVCKFLSPGDTGYLIKQILTLFRSVFFVFSFKQLLGWVD